MKLNRISRRRSVGAKLRQALVSDELQVRVRVGQAHALHPVAEHVLGEAVFAGDGLVEHLADLAGHLLVDTLRTCSDLDGEYGGSRHGTPSWCPPPGR